MLTRALLPFILVCGLTGCRSVKEEVGNYLKESLKDSVEREVDSQLAKRHTSIAEIQSNLVLNDPRGIRGLIGDLTKAVALTESEKLLKGVATKDEVDGKSSQFRNYLIGLLLMLLGKIGYSWKSNKTFKSRLEEVEKWLNFEGELDRDAKATIEAIVKKNEVKDAPEKKNG